jgi:hypothetical protein
MFESGPLEILTSPSKDTFIKAAEFKTSEDFSDAVVTVRRKTL